MLFQRCLGPSLAYASVIAWCLYLVVSLEKNKVGRYFNWSQSFVVPFLQSWKLLSKGQKMFSQKKLKKIKRWMVGGKLILFKGPVSSSRCSFSIFLNICFRPSDIFLSNFFFVFVSLDAATVFGLAVAQFESRFGTVFFQEGQLLGINGTASFSGND